MADRACPIVLMPAAGRGERFRSAGYVVLKPLIRFSLERNGSLWSDIMLGHALRGTEKWRRVIALPSVTGACAPASIDGREYVFLDRTEGQSDTVLALARYVEDHDGPVLVLNSDVQFRGTVLTQLDWFCQEMRVACGVLVVRRENVVPETRYLGDNSRSPFSHVSDVPTFVRAEEKPEYPATPWAIAGAFWFQSVQTLLGALHLQRAAQPNGERYLSEAMNNVYGTKFAMPILDEEFLEFGTPRSLRETINRMGGEMPIPENGWD